MLLPSPLNPSFPPPPPIITMKIEAAIVSSNAIFFISDSWIRPPYDLDSLFHLI
jgi:hypothetical protein